MAKKTKNDNIDNTIFDFDRIHEVDLKKTMDTSRRSYGKKNK